MNGVSTVNQTYLILLKHIQNELRRKRLSDDFILIILNI